MFFALEPHGPAPGWEAVVRGGLTGAPLAARVEGVRARLAALFGGRPGDVEWRVGASLYQQGLASRVLSPVLAAAVCHGVHLEPGNLFVPLDGPTAVRTLDTEARPLDPTGEEEAAVGPVERAVDGLGVVSEALVDLGRVAPGLLRGNTASALAGAARSLGGARPDHRRRAEEVVRVLLERPALVGTGALVGTDAHGSATFRRTTCCLYHRIPGGGLCGDCALRP
ncbi:ferric iron reductase [Nocardiopsis sp. MG754419]|nr:ferric iron reductase [Nocardiopsis sp. MG754419]